MCSSTFSTSHQINYRISRPHNESIGYPSTAEKSSPALIDALLFSRLMNESTLRNTVLIVDDEAIGRETLEDMLITQGYTLVFATNGFECLETAATLLPDVILLDVMMPDMDGFEVCRRLRNHPLLAEVPILLMTALDDQEARLTGINAGADDFISKPVDRNELRARLRTIMRLNRYQRLRSQRAQFAWVVDQAEDAYLVLGDNDEIMYANTQAQRYLGLPMSEDQSSSDHFLELAKRHYTLTPPEAWANWPEPLSINQPLRHLMRSESATTNQLWLQVDLMDMATRINDGHLVRLQDVTASIIEERMRWTFHAQVSHKLKTPLSHLMGSIELLIRRHADYSDEQRTDALTRVYDVSKQLQETMKGIFRYVEARELVNPGRDRTRLSDVNTIINTISQDLALAQIAIVPEDGLSLDDIIVNISFTAMEIIFWELLRNSQKFHPSQSPNIEIHVAQIEQNIRIRIIDNGVELSPVQLEKMWSPYYQIEKHFTGQVPGMGLGLSVVAAIMMNVGGSYRSYNRDDEPGIVIELILPTPDTEPRPSQK